MEQYIGYIRRSKKEYNSNLGIEAQQAEINKYNPVHTYIELEGGTASKRKRRTVILEAIQHCKDTGYTLVIAKLDRLARDVEFTANLMNSGVKFIALDIPGANHFTIHVMAAVAEQEAKRISERVKAALAVKTIKLGWYTHKTRQGCPITDEDRRKAGMIIRQRADSNPDTIRSMNYAYRLMQTHSVDQVCEIMNKEGFKSPKGKTITPTTISRWIKQRNRLQMTAGTQHSLCS